MANGKLLSICWPRLKVENRFSFYIFPIALLSSAHSKLGSWTLMLFLLGFWKNKKVSCFYLREESVWCGKRQLANLSFLWYIVLKFCLCAANHSIFLYNLSWCLVSLSPNPSSGHTESHISKNTKSGFLTSLLKNLDGLPLHSGSSPAFFSCPDGVTLVPLSSLIPPLQLPP